METITTDLLCIGAGLAGERVAVEAAARGFEAICLSIVPPRRSHSSAAQGGMQASLGNCIKGEGDNPDVHFADTVKGSDWGCDQEVARLFAETAPIAVREMAHWGVPWNRVVAGKSTYFKAGKEYEKIELQEKEGLITARDFGGTAKWRTCYTSDGTGHTLLFTMDNEVVRLGVTVHDRVEAVSLIHDGETCMGAVARCLRTGSLRVYLAKATLIATGGYGRLYRETTNAVINDGGGHHSGPRHRDRSPGQHGGRSVPSDRDRADEYPGHRRLPRGRRDPQGRQRRTVHGQIRAGQAGTGIPRRRFALDDAPHPPRDTASRAPTATICGSTFGIWGSNTSRPSSGRSRKSATASWESIPSPR